MSTVIPRYPIEQLGPVTLIGDADAVSASQYSGSVQSECSGAKVSGEILQLMLTSYHKGTGAVQKPACKLLAFDKDPTISAGAAALADQGSDHKNLIGVIAIADTDWEGDNNGAVVRKEVSIPFGPLRFLYFALRLDAAAGAINDVAGDDEKVDLRVWYRRDS